MWTVAVDEAWELARKNVAKAQKRQKTVYDCKIRPAQFQEGERVFLYKPAEKTGHARKFARAFHGPYRIVELTSCNAKIQRVDRPEDDTILVALERLRRCPEEVADDYMPPDRGRRRTRLRPRTAGSDETTSSSPG